MTLKARHIPGRLNVLADKLSRLGQIIQTKWSPSRGFLVDVHQVAPTLNRPLCNEVQQQVAPVCVTSSRQPSLGSRCTHLSWEHLDHYAFKPVAMDYPCWRIILIAPGWPNKPWFWDLVVRSSQIPPVHAQPTQSANHSTRLHQGIC